VRWRVVEHGHGGAEEGPASRRRRERLQGRRRALARRRRPRLDRRQAPAEVRRRRDPGARAREARQAQRAAAAGVVTDDRITVGAFLERWLTVNLPGSVAGGTLDDYADTIRLHLSPALGRKRLATLTVADVDGLWASKRKAGYKPNTIRIMRSVLRKALAQAEREGFVTRNVAALSQPPRVAQPEGRSLSIEQAKTLLDAAKGDRLEVAYLVLLSYGLRRGELLGLAWADFDPEPATLAVRQAVTTRKSPRHRDEGADGVVSRIELSALKTRRSRRVLFLTPGIVAALGEHAERQQAEREAAGELWVDHDLIFTSRIGTPIDPDNFAKRFVQLCKTAGLGHWHPHEARHSAASVMLAQGVPLEVVSEVLGHSSIYIPKDVYGHLVEGAKRDAAERMAAAFGR
jgi:integrase